MADDNILKDEPTTNLTHGQCPKCNHVRVINTPRGSRFLLCKLSEKDAHYPKYPHQPVRSCKEFAILPEQNG